MRFRQPRKRQRCWDSRCGKFLYASLRAARHWLEKYETEQAVDLEIYACPHSRGWHLTSMTESE